MPTISISLSRWWKEFIDELVKTGVYQTQSELIRAALLVWHEEVWYKSKGMQHLGVTGDKSENSG